MSSINGEVIASPIAAPVRFTGKLAQIGALSVTLVLLSFGNPFVVAALNRVCRHPPDSPTGWALYTLVRVLFSGVLAWRILSLHRGSAQPWTRGGGDGRRWLDPLMGLRAMAAIMVLLGHHFGQVWLSGTYPPLPWLLPLLRSNPYAGVWIFFTLSGFLMGKGFASRYALTEGGVFAFYRNRLLRIWPIYLAALGLVGVLTAPALLLPQNWWQWIEVALFDYRGDLPLPPIGALWSVSTEVQFYLLAPFLYAALVWCRVHMRSRFIFLPFSLLLAGVALRQFIFFWFARHALPLPGTPLDMFVYKPLLPQLDLFAAGMSLNLLPPPRELNRWLGLPPTAALLLAASAIYCITATVQHAGLGYSALTTRYFIVVPCLVALLTLGWIRLAMSTGPLEIQPGWRGGWLRAVNWVGILTYCIYVFHIPVLVSARRLLPEGLLSFRESLSFFPLVAATTLAVAFFFYRFVEEPFERRKSLTGTHLADAP